MPESQYDLLLSRPAGRCPVQPSTPLGPDQVNVIYLLFIYYLLLPLATMLSTEFPNLVVLRMA
jgi:hypothetical protein